MCSAQIVEKLFLLANIEKASPLSGKAFLFANSGLGAVCYEVCYGGSCEVRSSDEGGSDRWDVVDDGLVQTEDEPVCGRRTSAEDEPVCAMDEQT